MQADLNFIIGLYIVQGAVAIGLAWVFQHFAKRYGRAYLRHWSMAWFALAVFQFAAVASLGIAVSGGLVSGFRLIISGISQAAAYGFVVLLVLGAYEVAWGRWIASRTANWLVGSALAIGAFSALLFAFDPGAGDQRLIVRVGVRDLVTGVAFAWAAVMVWQSCEEHGGFGRRLVAASFGLYGLEQIHIAVMMVWRITQDVAPGYLQYLGLVDLLALFAIGIGTVIWLLEEEQARVARAGGEIERLAMEDALTGLANRQRLSFTLGRLVANAGTRDERLAVLLMDLDRFKVVNEAMGHSVGDKILREVANRLREAMRADDFVARLGGDEFTIIGRGIRGPHDALTVARKITEALRQPFNIDGNELTLTTSIGVSIFPDDASDAETLLRQADTAMYSAKRAGGSGCELFTTGMEQAAEEQLQLENELRRALANDELVVVYQPICTTEDQRIVGVEALVRWQHPSRGLLPPGVFLGAAESSGLMDAIDEQVIRAACSQVVDWNRRLDRRIFLAANISPGGMNWPGLAARIESLLRETGMPARQLELEITEHAAIRDLESGHTTLRKLRRIGVHTAIDDFGTGYSSLSYLKRLPVDKIKLDRTFIDDVLADTADAAIVDAVVALAHSLGLSVVAEGVETPEQLEYLRGVGCDLVQGYLLHRPLPAERVERLLAGDDEVQHLPGSA